MKPMARAAAAGTTGAGKMVPKAPAKPAKI